MQVIISQPDWVSHSCFSPEFTFFLLELSAQRFISINVWIMHDHRALYKGLCYSCTVLLNRKLFCVPSWRKRVADWSLTITLDTILILYNFSKIFPGSLLNFTHAKKGAGIRIIWLIYFCNVLEHGWTSKACKQKNIRIAAIQMSNVLIVFAHFT